MRRFAVRFTGRLRRPAVLDLVARIIFCLTELLFLRRPVSRLGSLLPFTSTSVVLLPALDNMLVGALVVPRLLAQRRESPRRLRMITLDLAFASAVRMIHGIHGHTANRGPDAAPARTSRFSERFVLMVKVADLANRGHALHGEFAYFAGRQLDQRDFAFLAQELRRTARRANHLTAAPGIQLEVVHHRARRDVFELQRIARKNVRAFAGGNRGADFEADGMNDVTFLAISVVQQRQIRAAVRVVFNGRHFRGHASLFAPEVHLAILLLMTAAAVPNHDFTVIVAPARTFLRLEQRLLRLLLGDVALVHDGDKPPRRRVWIKALQSHRCLLPSKSLSRPRLTGSPRTRSFFRLRPASHKPFSSRAGSLRSGRAGAFCRR